MPLIAGTGSCCIPSTSPSRSFCAKRQTTEKPPAPGYRLADEVNHDLPKASGLSRIFGVGQIRSLHARKHEGKTQCRATMIAGRRSISFGFIGMARTLQRDVKSACTMRRTNESDYSSYLFEAAGISLQSSRHNYTRSRKTRKKHEFNIHDPMRRVLIESMRYVKREMTRSRNVVCYQ